MTSAAERDKNILVVEDDTIIREAMKMVLEWEGYKVATAANGREALDRLRWTDPPGLILLDLMMPVMDGWQFLHDQKQDPALASIPVVVVTAAADATPRDVAGRVQKPFQPEELLETLRRQK
jgi:CheY-like chemotaxis protein